MCKIAFCVWTVSFVGIHVAKILAIACLPKCRGFQRMKWLQPENMLYVKLLKHHSLCAGIAQG